MGHGPPLLCMEANGGFWGRRRPILYRAEIGSSGWMPDLRESQGEQLGGADSRPSRPRPGTGASTRLRRIAAVLPERARYVAKELRSQGERAVGTVSQQVEHNPVTSLAVAFAVGFICASLIRR